MWRLLGSGGTSESDAALNFPQHYRRKDTDHDRPRTSTQDPDYDTAEREAERQRKQSIGGYGRFNVVTVSTMKHT